MGATVLMGRLGPGSPCCCLGAARYPGRRNLVLSSLIPPGRRMAGLSGWAPGRGRAIGLADGDLWVIGGAAVYSAALPFGPTGAVVTYVDLTCEGDVFAPELAADWRPTLLGDWETSATGAPPQSR